MSWHQAGGCWRRRRVGRSSAWGLACWSVCAALSGWGEEGYVSEPAGFVRVGLASNSAALVSLSFEPFDGGLAAVFANQLTGAPTEEAADRVVKWDGAAQQYLASYKAAGTGNPALDGEWLAGGTTDTLSSATLDAGEGFWIENRHETRDVFLAGAVVLAGTQTVALLEGLNLVAYPFSSRIDLNDSALAGCGAEGWTNVAGSDRVIEGVHSNVLWLLDQPGHPNHGRWLDLSGILATQALGMSTGFWYERAVTNGMVWAEPRPYAEVLGVGVNAPAITALVLDPELACVTLSIGCSGQAGETLEVLYKDVTEAESLVSDSGWLVADEGIATTGRTTIAWTDAGGVGRAGVDEVFCRVYLIGRQDADADGDGLSDARERFVHGTSGSLSDTDGDGLSDGDEIGLYGTDPLEADSDEDGMTDGAEVRWGRDPMNSDEYANLPWGAGFEVNEGYAVGDLGGQLGWTALGGSAQVQTAVIALGEQAARLGAGEMGEQAVVEHLFAANTGTVVWVDATVRMVPGGFPDTTTGLSHLTAVFVLTEAGYLAGYDGTAGAWVVATNAPRVKGVAWLHLTVRNDYGAGTWTLYRDGVPVLAELGFADESVKEFSRLEASAPGLGGAALDGIGITEQKPEFIDSDGDGLADVVEDADADGTVDAGETDPLDADTDGDGMDDGREVELGYNPTVSNDFAQLPWSAGFEAEEGYAAGSLDGQAGWTAGASVTVQAADRHAGTNAARIAGSPLGAVGMAHCFGGAGEGVVWVDGYVRLRAGALPDPGTGSDSILVAVDENGVLRAYDGEEQEWTAAAGACATAPGEWARVTFRVDYVAKRWTLYVDSTRVFRDLAFADAGVRWLSRLEIEAPEGSPSESAYVDSLSAGVTEPPGLDDDGDGMPNAWEILFSLDPSDPSDSSEDPDADGLTNLEEFQSGTNPFDPDTDGDGVSDGMEVHDMATDPSSADITGILTVSSVDGAQTTNVLGQWATNGTAIYAQSRRGAVEYALDVAAPDVYRIEIEGAAHDPFRSENDFDLLLTVDGEYLGRHVLRTQGATSAVVHAITPWLPAGEHSLRIYWDNVAEYRSVQVNVIRLQALLGPDADSDGVKDWIESMLEERWGVEFAPEESVVSPVCVEGRGGYLSVMSVSGATVQHGAGERWYADVPLCQTGATEIVTSFQNGSRIVTNQVRWLPLNLIGASDMTIRKGDALMLTAFPQGATNGTVTVSISGATSYVTTVEAPVVHVFASAGLFTIVGTYDDGNVTTDTIQVKVVEAAFNGSPACWVGRNREWECPGIPGEAVIESDSAMLLEDLGASTNGGRTFGLRTDSAETAYVIARLGTDGPVLANAATAGFNLYSTVQTYTRVVETYTNGDQLIETLLVEFPIIDDVMLRLEMIVGGVLFEDGLGVHEVEAADLDELGEHKVRFIRPAAAQTSICHILKAYQGAAYVGMR